jgi:hypothetical protein
MVSYRDSTALRPAGRLGSILDQEQDHATSRHGGAPRTRLEEPEQDRPTILYLLFVFQRRLISSITHMTYYYTTVLCIQYVSMCACRDMIIIRHKMIKE